MATNDFLVKVAEVLEAAASHIEETENAKLAASAAEKQTIISALASKYAEATGDTLPTEVQHKLANVDGDVVNLVNSLIEKHAGSIEAMGSPSTVKDNDAVVSTKEAANQAEDKFVSWILS